MPESLMPGQELAGPLEVKNLAAGYGKGNVIEGIGLDVRAGEIFGLIGLNGAGKTTLIRAILGIGLSKGVINIFGEPAGPPKSRGSLVYLPERFQPSPLLRGWEFLSLTLAYYKLALSRDAARSLCAGLDLDETLLGRSVRTYSKGTGQKLGLVATLLTGLPFLILDEPMSGLDPRARILLKDRLQEYRARGNSVFFSSHILSDIEEICDRVAVLHRGAVVFAGTPDELMKEFGGATLERSFLAAIAKADVEFKAFPPGR